MSYPRNAVSPPPICVGEIYQLSDGAIQTSGVSVRVKIGTGSFAAGSGTLTCDATSGAWYYAPTQAETNAETFIVTIYKASCTTASVTVPTSASATAGYVGTDHSKIANPTATVDLSGTTVAKSPATLDWDADVTNKPTIGTSTFDPALHAVSLAAQVITDLFGDADATQLLADFLDGVAAKFDAVDDTAVAIIATKTITDLLANATFAQLIADAAAAKASAASAASSAAAAKLVTDKLDTALEDDGADGYQLTTLALDNITLNAALCNKIADHVLRRTHTNIEASSDGDSLSLESVYGTGRTMLRANTTATAGTLTVLKTDGTTLGTRTLDTDTGLDDVQGIGP